MGFSGYPGLLATNPFAQPHAGQPERPTVPFILSLLGGIFILFAAAWQWLLWNVGGGINPGGPAQPVGAPAQFWYNTALFGLVGIIIGVLIVVLSILLYVQPHLHVVYGTFILVFSFISLVSSFGGFFVGFTLALVGGILGMAWAPRPRFAPFYPTMPMIPPPPTQVLPDRVCLRCGRLITTEGRFCPHCGTQFA
jgi:uncharacterized protein DUF6114